MKHRIRAVFCAAVVVLPLIKQFGNRTSTSPGAPAFEPGLAAKRHGPNGNRGSRLASGSLQLYLCLMKMDSRGWKTLWFGTKLFETISSFRECSIECGASGLLFLGNRPILFCGCDFINLLAQKMKSWKKNSSRSW